MALTTQGIPAPRNELDLLHKTHQSRSREGEARWFPPPPHSLRTISIICPDMEASSEIPSELANLKPRQNISRPSATAILRELFQRSCFGGITDWIIPGKETTAPRRFTSSIYKGPLVCQRLGGLPSLLPLPSPPTCQPASKEQAL